MRMLMVHHADVTDGGEAVRARRVLADLRRACPAEVVEVRLGPALSNGRRRPPVRVCGDGIDLQLPVTLPYTRLRPVAWASRRLQRALGARLAARYRPDLVLGETHGSWWLASAIADEAGCPLVMDVHGAAPEENFHTVRRRSSAGVLERIEREMVESAPLLLCQSEAMVSHLRGKHPGLAASLYVYRCGVDVRQFQFRAEARDEVRRQFGINPAEVVFAYAGSTHSWQMLPAMLRTCVALRASGGAPARFLILTNDLEGMKNLVAEYGLAPDTVHMLSAPHLRVPEYLSAADAAFLIREDSVINRVACPTKLGEYLACGLPVITSGVARHWPPWNSGSECFCVIDENRPEESAAGVWEFLAARRVAEGGMRARCRQVAIATLSSALDSETIAQVLPGLIEYAGTARH